VTPFVRCAVLVGLVATLPSGCRRATQKDWPPAMTTATPEQAAARVRAAKGEVVVFVLYASWCSGCRAEIPGVDSVSSKLSGRGMEVMAYALDEDPVDYDEMLADHTPSFPLVRVAPMTNADLVAAVRGLGGSYGESIPYTAVFDRQGTLVREWKDGVGARELEQTVSPLL
jgi:thiol-disulfide isomerase/thioredoxin